MARNWMSSGSRVAIALVCVGCGGGKAHEASGAEEKTAGSETKAKISEESLRSISTDIAKEQQAQAKLEAAPNVELKGEARFEPATDGVHVSVSIEDATPGAHGIHVHQVGDCSDIPGKSMGEHLETAGHPHGLPQQPVHHLGDMGNIEVGPDGKGKLDFVIKDATLGGGSNSLLGKALVVHEKEDIGTGKSGESGSPIACGVIERKP